MNRTEAVTAITMAPAGGERLNDCSRLVNHPCFDGCP